MATHDENAELDPTAGAGERVGAGADDPTRGAGERAVGHEDAGDSEDDPTRGAGERAEEAPHEARYRSSGDPYRGNAEVGAGDAGTWREDDQTLSERSREADPLRGAGER